MIDKELVKMRSELVDLENVILGKEIILESVETVQKELLNLRVRESELIEKIHNHARS